MPATHQLHLFDPAKPLLERFGPGFFKAVPRRPGVYIMGGEGERVLYIGQSKNLRQRLGSYKNARPDRAPRKIIRLVHSVRTLVWEECQTAEAARLKEAQLLRVHRPRFNVQNTWPRAHRFVNVKRNETGLAFSLGGEPLAEGKSYGAFKNGATRAYGALLRLVWTGLRQPRSPHDFPAALAGVKPPRDFSLSLPSGIVGFEAEDLAARLDAFLLGESDVLIAWLTNAVPVGPEISTFQRNLHADDLETLARFFEHGPRRNRDLRQRHGLDGPLIPSETLDDLLALAPQNRRPPGASSEQPVLFPP